MKILILNAHPYSKSFCDALAQSYKEGAVKGGHEVQFFNVRDLNFSPNLSGAYKEHTELEADLVKQQELLKWCDHLVIVTPFWWASVPAIFKGYIDRVLLAGFAFRYSDKGELEGLLKEKSARVIYTQDSPRIYSDLILGNSFWRIMKKGILEFCGFKPVKRTVFSEVVKSTDEVRRGWLKLVAELGQKGE